MATFGGEDPFRWKEQFCVGCRQVTWHYDGLCSNRDFHLSATSYTIEQSQPPPPDVPIEESHDEAAAKEC